MRTGTRPVSSFRWTGRRRAGAGPGRRTGPRVVRLRGAGSRRPPRWPWPRPRSACPSRQSTMTEPVTRPNFSDRPSEFSICSSAASVWLSSAYCTRSGNSQLAAMRPAVGATQVSSMRAMLAGSRAQLRMRGELIAHDPKHHDGRESIQQADELRDEGFGSFRSAPRASRQPTPSTACAPRPVRETG